MACKSGDAASAPARRLDVYFQAKAHAQCRQHGGVGETAKRSSRERRGRRFRRAGATAFCLLCHGCDATAGSCCGGWYLRQVCGAACTQTKVCKGCVGCRREYASREAQGGCMRWNAGQSWRGAQATSHKSLIWQPEAIRLIL